jgi:DNA invertase Pin-like site-specific DNA recombinase
MSVAEWEREIIGQRIREALAVRRAQGHRLRAPPAIPVEVAEKIKALRANGLTLQAICDELNRTHVATARGGSEWRPTSLRALLPRVRSRRRSNG